MRRLPRFTWISIVITGVLTILGSVTGSIGATALSWLSPQVALLLFVLISLALIGVSLWTAAEQSADDMHKHRQVILERVQSQWITGFLENQLYYSYGEQLLPLSLHERAGSRFNLVLSNPLGPAQAIPSGTIPVQVFDRARGELLILGEPGAGKTTLLLELTRDLLKRAEDNPAAPIPIVLTLSWNSSRRLSLEEWIAEKLEEKYDVPFQIGKAWVKANQLLLLLDGLDEVDPQVLPACIDAINAYYHQAHRPLVVCSRTKEFLNQSGRLALHTAVIVQPLSPEQIDTYLKSLTAKGEDVEGLKDALSQSEDLRKLAATPLLLTVLILAYHGKSVQELLALVKTMPTNQQYLLFHNYIERSLQRKGTRIQASAQQAKHWLSWLARQMTASYMSELNLRRFQPDWLPKRQRIFYQGNTLVVGLVMGLAVGLVGRLSNGQSPVLELFSGLVAGLFVGVVGVTSRGIAASGSRERGQPTITYSLGPFREQVDQGPTIGLARRMITLFAEGRLTNPKTTWSLGGQDTKLYLLGQPFTVLLAGVLAWVLAGVDFEMLTYVLALFSTTSVGLMGRPPFKKIHIFALILFDLSMLILLFLWVFVLRTDLGPNGLAIVLGMSIGFLLEYLLEYLLSNSFKLSLSDTIQNYVLRFWLWQARCTPAPWRYIAFLDDAVEQQLLRKVGGRYLFRHRLLQDYFASLDLVSLHSPSFHVEVPSVSQNAPTIDSSK